MTAPNFIPSQSARRLSAAVLITMLAAAAPAGAAIELSYEHPQRYTDASLRGGAGVKARAAALEGLREHLERLAARHLRPDQALSIAVLDLDLAGQFEPWRAHAFDVRFLREVTPPRIKLRYALRQAGAVVAQAEETVSDINYLGRPDARLRDDPLRYEKAMLEDWFRARFAPR